MGNKTIRIALSSVLIYVIFKKFYSILYKILIWLNVDLRLENEFILLSELGGLGVLSIGLLAYLYNHYLKKDTPNIRAIYFLILVVVILILIYTVINKLFSNYLVDVSMEGVQNSYFNQIVWSEALDGIFPFTGLIYFLWKFKSDKTNLITNSSNEET